MSDVEVHIELDGQTHRVGLLRRNVSRRAEKVTFEYDPTWLGHPHRFPIDPSLPLTRGAFPPPKNMETPPAINDSAPDTWGRRLLRRAERRQAEKEKRTVRTLTEMDFILGVSDRARMGALRFREVGEDHFQSQSTVSVPARLGLRRLLEITERVQRDEETAEDLQDILAPGSSLGGARPKATVFDQYGNMSIAKFPKESDTYSIERWEAIALRLAAQSGIETPNHELASVAGKTVLLSRRFDRNGDRRIPYMSAMAMTGSQDGQSGSYPEIVDVMSSYAGHAKSEAEKLYRRMVFNILVSNVDDHLRNHGFLRADPSGWRLSPAFDLNPVPTDEKARVLSTNIDLDDGTCSIELAESVAGYFGLRKKQAREVIKQVAHATSQWRTVASAAGAKLSEIDRMASAFEHNDLTRALAI
jgi:serine/threonine-protein kinase HipA